MKPNEQALAASVARLIAQKETPDKAADRLLWDALSRQAGQPFCTAKGLTYCYGIRGNEMFVSRKDKSITYATVMVAFHKAVALQAAGQAVSGPKKLGTFGASYLYPVFCALGVIGSLAGASAAAEPIADRSVRTHSGGLAPYSESTPSTVPGK